MSAVRSSDGFGGCRAGVVDGPMVAVEEPTRDTSRRGVDRTWPALDFEEGLVALHLGTGIAGSV